eukprot:1388344-Amorphochlora_amoeboformis.AAC.1
MKSRIVIRLPFEIVVSLGYGFRFQMMSGGNLFFETWIPPLTYSSRRAVFKPGRAVRTLCLNE